jgi:hypothetical protein
MTRPDPAPPKVKTTTPEPCPEKAGFFCACRIASPATTEARKSQGIAQAATLELVTATGGKRYHLGVIARYFWRLLITKRAAQRERNTEKDKAG